MGSWLPGGGRSAGRRPIALGVGSSLCTGQKDPSWAWHSQAASLPGNSQKNLVGVGAGGGARDMWTVLGHLMSSAPA